MDRTEPVPPSILAPQAGCLCHSPERDTPAFAKAMQDKTARHAHLRPLLTTYYSLATRPLRDSVTSVVNSGVQWSEEGRPRFEIGDSKFE